MEGFVDEEGTADLEDDPAKQPMFAFNVEFYLGEYHFIESRSRYNFWDLLGDVGGFHDGIILVFSLFMGSFSALAFKVDFLNFSQVDNDASRSGSSRPRIPSTERQSIELLKQNQDCTLDSQTLRALQRTVGMTTVLKDSILSYLGRCFGSLCRKKSKKERLQAKIMDNLDHRLDIRHLLRDLTKLSLFVKHMLTPQQELLLALQKKRLPCLADTDSADSS